MPTANPPSKARILTALCGIPDLHQRLTTHDRLVVEVLRALAFSQKSLSVAEIDALTCPRFSGEGEQLPGKYSIEITRALIQAAEANFTLVVGPERRYTWMHEADGVFLHTFRDVPYLSAIDEVIR